jgi:hypothetical protein
MNIDMEIPKQGYLYILGKKPLRKTLFIGPIIIGMDTSKVERDIDKVEFYIDGELKATDYNEPYQLLWDEPAFFKQHKIKIVAYDTAGNSATDEKDVLIFNI